MKGNIMNGYIMRKRHEKTGRRKGRLFVLGTVIWAGIGTGALLAQTPAPGGPGGAGQVGATAAEPSNPCVQATQILAQQKAWQQRLDAIAEKIHTGVRNMDETALRGMEEEINAIGKEQEALESASEACRNYVERLQVLSQCEQIPYLEAALNGAAELIQASAELSIAQSGVLPFVQNVQVQTMPWQMMPGQMMPGQMMPGQMMPGQIMPGQMMPVTGWWGGGGGMPGAGMSALDSMSIEPNRQLGEVLQRLQEARAACAAERSVVP